jgi:hypothetical protein
MQEQSGFGGSNSGNGTGLHGSNNRVGNPSYLIVLQHIKPGVFKTGKNSLLYMPINVQVIK